MRILVTGGTGFLGRHVCRALKDRGHRVAGVGRGKYVDHVVGHEYDLTDRDMAHNLILDADPDVVVHLAAAVGGIGANVANPAKFWRDNLYMGLNVLDACAFRKYSDVHGGGDLGLHRHAGEAYPEVSRLIIAGTTCSYPEIPPVIPFREEVLFMGYPEPTNAPYGIAKRCIVVGAQAYRESGFIDSRVLMPTNLYGPGDSLDLENNHVIPALIVKFLRAKNDGTRVVELWGTGEPTRDFLYVEDAAEAFADAVDNEEDWSLLNLGTGQEVSIREIAETISKLTEYDGDVTWNGRLGGQPRRALDCGLAEKYLGWTAKTSLEEGLAKTIRWVKENLSAP